MGVDEAMGSVAESARPRKEIDEVRIFASTFTFQLPVMIDDGWVEIRASDTVLYAVLSPSVGAKRVLKTITRHPRTLCTLAEILSAQPFFRCAS